MTTVLDKNIQTREEIIAELKRREGGKTMSIEEAYKRGHDYINNLGR